MAKKQSFAPINNAVGEALMDLATNPQGGDQAVAAAYLAHRASKAARKRASGAKRRFKQA